MQSLIGRLRASRETIVEAGGWKFTIRRPTGMALARSESSDALLRSAVIGWEIPEHEVVPGGGPEPAKWDVDACMEFLEDRPTLYSEILDRINEIVGAYVEKLKEVEKK